MREEMKNIGLHPKGLENSIISDQGNTAKVIFYKKYGQLPNRRCFEGFDKEKLLNRIEEEFALRANQIIVSDDIENGKKIMNFFIADIGDECILYVPSYSYNGEGGILKIYYSCNTSEKTIEQLEGLIKQCKENKVKNNLFLLSNEDFGMDFKSFEIKNTDINLETHYNDDFIEVDKLIKSKLNKKGEKGIVLIHGDPGTGKTSYIRHLIGEIDKKMIYIPSDMSENLADPKLIQLLSRNPDSVLIIEDAESVLVDRGTSKNSAISNLLNIADGLLSDCLNIQLICTFNVHISKIDNALLRKGRIIASYEMKKLSLEKTANLLKEKYNTFAYESLNLAQIYNYDEPDFDRTEKQIGFGVEI